MGQVEDDETLTLKVNWILYVQVIFQLGLVLELIEIRHQEVGFLPG